MRWIDIDLGTSTRSAGTAACLEHASARLEQLPMLQRREGLDSPVLLRFMATIGQQLFRAVTASRRDAFAPDDGASGASEPPWPGRTGRPDAVGYHLIVDENWIGLPWSWLHNGLRFVIETAPICVGTFGSDPAAGPDRAWCRRRGDVLLAGEALGPEPLARVLDRLRPAGCAEPEILYLTGTGPSGASARARREAELVGAALTRSPSGRVLASLREPRGGVAPGELGRLGLRYQGFHFAGSTATPGCAPGAAAPPSASAAEPEADRPHTSNLALAEPTASEEAAAGSAPARDDGGSDRDSAPVTALMAEVAAARHQPLARRRGFQQVRLPLSADPVGAWMLDDGPFRPENLAGIDTAPALVFSNSFRSLPDLARRFLSAGVSAFVGTHMAVKPDFAAAFAADFYGALAEGAGAAVACREAALAARDRRGDHNPAWLAYGIAGSGTLALPFL